MDTMIVEITTHATDEVYPPAFLMLARHVFKTDPTEAIAQIDGLLGGNVKPNGLLKILMGEYEPVFDFDDLRNGSITFALPQNEVLEAAYK